MSRIPVPSSQQKKTGMAIIAGGSAYKKPSHSDLKQDPPSYDPQSIYAEDISDDDDGPEPYVPSFEDEKPCKPPSMRDLKNNDDKFKPPSIKDLKNTKNEYKPPSMAELRADKNTYVPPSIKDIKNNENEYRPPSMHEFKKEKPNVQFTIEQPIEEPQPPQHHEPQYTPYTVDDYKNIQQMDNAINDRGGLGPSLDEEWERKKEMRAKIMQFAKKTANENKSLLPKKKKKEEPKPKAPTKRDKMKEYAAHLPKPKAASEKPKSARSRKAAPIVAKYDVHAELQRHQHFVARVATLYEQVAQYLE